jgi:predicted nuclease of restriction endonuclease-like (RecB) superfamily
MANEILLFSGNEEYLQWLAELKQRIRQKQMKAALAVNQQLIELYAEMGKMIVEKQEASKWGSGLLNQLAKDLKTEFPDMGGFSQSNLYVMRKFYMFYFQQDTIFQQLAGKLNSEKIRQLVGQIPWRHLVLILQKKKNQQEDEEE